mmetsp:Transcript_18127/g.41123  ORF Transcript_18127/g.41123 Transcript_18127/m.41123 type:complete len:98 (-) Transcript_18127:328-621(-)
MQKHFTFALQHLHVMDTMKMHSSLGKWVIAQISNAHLTQIFDFLLYKMSRSHRYILRVWVSFDIIYGQVLPQQLDIFFLQGELFGSFRDEGIWVVLG